MIQAQSKTTAFEGTFGVLSKAVFVFGEVL